MADVLTLSTHTRKAAPCSRCGNLTTTRKGVCRACHNGDSLPDVRALTTERIAFYLAALRAELARRQDEIRAALETRP